MYALVNKFSDRVLNVDVLVGMDGCIQYYASVDGDIPLIHSTPTNFKMLFDRYPEYQYSYQFPCVDDVDLNDYEIRQVYLSHEELVIEMDMR